MTQPNGHPITLETVVFTKSFVQAVPDYDPNVERTLVVQPENNIHVTKVDGTTGTYAATMSSVFNRSLDTGAPYYFDMECMAMLHSDDTLSEDEALRGVTITAHQVLYGAIREAVAWATGRQPYGALIVGLSVLRSGPRPNSSSASDQSDMEKKSDSASD
jgi:hypothetical protein